MDECIGTAGRPEHRFYCSSETKNNVDILLEIVVPKFKNNLKYLKYCLKVSIAGANP